MDIYFPEFILSAVKEFGVNCKVKTELHVVNLGLLVLPLHDYSTAKDFKMQYENTYQRDSTV